MKMNVIKTALTLHRIMWKQTSLQQHPMAAQCNLPLASKEVLDLTINLDHFKDYSIRYKLSYLGLTHARKPYGKFLSYM
jgi:hypothetical protein